MVSISVNNGHGMHPRGMGMTARSGVIRAPQVGPNDVLLRATGYVAPSLCGGISPPEWTFSAPTPLLIQKGLTAQVLQEELDTINAKSRENMQGVKNYMPYSMIPCLLVIIGFILFPVGFAGAGDSTLGILGFVLFGVGSCCTLCACCIASTKTMQEMAPRTEKTRQYIEVDLNNKYQEQYGIRWGIEQETTLHTTGSRENRRVTTKTLHHIKISPVDTGAMVQQVQQPQVLYVDQNGNPINPNPVQVVVVQTQNQNTATSEGVAPPAYTPNGEAPPADTYQ